MNLKKKLILLTTALIAAFGTVIGQPAYDLNFQGMLADIQGNSISKEPFELTVQLRPESGQEILFEFSSSTTTDDAGWFGFTISEISRYLVKNGKLSESVVVRMDFAPTENSRWLKKGEDFMVTYTVAPDQAQDSKQLKITRMEGSELMVHAEDNLFAFKDQYPFAYLTGGFLMTDKPPVTAQSVADLKQWLKPDNQDGDGAASRGVKGGFPAGGYYKKK